GDALRILLGVRERQSRAPRAAEHEPALDLEVRAQALDVLDQVPGRVVHETRGRAALTAAALIEQDDTIAPGIEQSAHLDVRAAAGAAVQKDRRLAARIAALLEVDLVQIRDLEETYAVGFYGGIQAAQLLRL